MAEQDEQILGVVVDQLDVKYFKDLLKNNSLLSTQFKIKQISDKSFFIPTEKDLHHVVAHLSLETKKYQIESVPKNSLAQLKPSYNLADLLASLFPHGLIKGYERYNNFLIISTSNKQIFDEFFIKSHSNLSESEEFKKLTEMFQVIALKQPIQSNQLRSPSLVFIYKYSSIYLESFWTQTCQNGIMYSWLPYFTMFCPGNITEKIRVGEFNCAGETILDLYAGIGYFVLPYLIHAHAAKVIAIDMNEYSIEALKRNLLLNKIPKEKCLVLCGNNETFLDEYNSLCHRVNLGLIPSSKSGWHLAIQALRETGGWLHVHGNVQEGEESQFQTNLIESLTNLWIKYKPTVVSIQVKHVQKVKSYAPHINHLVFDVHIHQQ